VTDDNLVGECPDGFVLSILEAKRIEDKAYYNVQCGEIEGWIEQANLIGPLIYRPDDFVIIYVPSQFVYVDELSPDAVGATAAIDDTETADSAIDDNTDNITDGETDNGADGESGGEDNMRPVVEYTPPAYLTDAPGPVILQGENSNVVGQCGSQATANILDYQGVDDIVYYQITCDRCTESDETGACLATESQQGWIKQASLKGPLDFAPGDSVQFRASSKAIMTDAETGTQYARIPSNITGASAIGDYTTYDGRCLYEDGMTVTGVVLDKARTSNRFIFYYAVECEGQPAIITLETDHAGKTRPVITYDTEKTDLVSGYALGRELEPVDNEG
jgi:hypothetical protein